MSNNSQFGEGHFIQKHGTAMGPRNARSYDRYTIEGRGNRKFSIVDSTTLQRAYKTITNKILCLWIEVNKEAGGTKRACEGKSAELLIQINACSHFIQAI